MTTNKHSKVANLPTVSLEAKMLSCAIEAKDNRYVVVTDISGAFPYADMEGTVYLILEGEVTESIVNLEPETYRNSLW